MSHPRSLEYSEEIIMNRKRGICSFSLISLIIIFPLHILVTNAQYASFAQGIPTIYLRPIRSEFFTNQTFVGDRFNVTVYVQDAPPIAAWQVHMEFNDSIINVTRWIEPTTDSQYIFHGKTTFANPIPPDPGYVHLDSGRARVQVTSPLFPTPPTQAPSSGSGSLCIFEFVIVAYPTNDMISSLLSIDSTDTVLLEPSGNDINPISKQDGFFNYTYVTTPPPPLRLVENPQFIQFTPYQNMTGNSFNTTIFVEGPASTVGLTSVSFTLSYDPFLFSINDVVLNNIWMGSHSDLTDPGQVTVMVSCLTPLSSEFTTGICTISLTVQGQETTPPQTLGYYVDTGINFTSSALLNSVGIAITQIPSYNQTVRIYAYQSNDAVLTITQPAIVGQGATIQNRTLFNVNVTVTDLYNPSVIQVKLFYDDSVMICIGITLIGEVESDELTDNLSQPGQATAKVSISGHTTSLISGPIFQFQFRAVTENAASNLNFSKPYGQDTFIQDTLGAIANATYLETTVHISARAVNDSNAGPPWELIIPAIIIGVGIAATITFIAVKGRRRKKRRLMRRT
jgi:hypothetical protein